MEINICRGALFIALAGDPLTNRSLGARVPQSRRKKNYTEVLAGNTGSTASCKVLAMRTRSANVCAPILRIA